MLNYISTHGLLLFYYSLFFIAVYTSSKNSSGQLWDILCGKGEAGILFSRMLAGIFFLGIGAIHLIIKRNPDAAIFTPAYPCEPAAYWVIPAAAAALAGMFSALKKITPAVQYTAFLPFHLPLSFVLVRTLFLIVYEFFFRGVLLFIMLSDLGTVAAIAINIVLYVFIHWFDKKERYGSVPMGLLLCVVSIYYRSVWPAIAIHMALALSHEITLLIKNRSLIKKLSL